MSRSCASQDAPITWRVCELKFNRPVLSRCLCSDDLSQCEELLAQSRRAVFERQPADRRHFFFHAFFRLSFVHLATTERTVMLEGSAMLRTWDPLTKSMGAAVIVVPFCNGA